MFGSHLSIAGSMVNALHEAEKLGLDTVQVFTKNQQQWKAKPLDTGMVREWHSEVARLGWQGRTVSHASYLINLASCKPDLWRQSVDLMVDEVHRCETLAIPFLVHHPGSFVGADLEHGLGRIVDAYTELFAKTRGFNTVCCLEGTVGAGSTIGGRFEHLATLRERIAAATGEPGRIAFCLDTCHMHAAGYDMSTRASANAALDQFDALCGLANLKVLHINDSKGVVASKLDRHQHIGEGTIGGNPHVARPSGRAFLQRLASSGFAAVVNRPGFDRIPKILETPKEPGPGTPGQAKTAAKPALPLDAINLDRLKGLIDPSHPPSGQPVSPSPATPRPVHPKRKTPATKRNPAPIAPPRPSKSRSK